ncbi:hypothetical protein RRG08_061129 [Elysia crispata]|uniref:Secreted protein n=1 Tax=Elysia crispata TaxID=231223 RepID=A0AAE1CEJ1_9GAST|nr:hypothetical protein RRG08_061129 [Elysia crispata]
MIHAVTHVLFLVQQWRVMFSIQALVVCEGPQETRESHISKYYTPRGLDTQYWIIRCQLAWTSHDCLMWAELQMPWVEMEHRFKYLPAVFRRSDGFKLDLWNGAVE